MADNDEGEPQAGEPEQSTPAPGGPTTTTSTPPAGGDGNTTTETISLEEARKLRSEAQNLRKRLKSYEDAERAAQEAQMTAQQKLEKQYADLQAQHEAHVRSTQERIIRYEVEAQARKLNIIDPDAAAKLLDWSELEFDDEGLPINAGKLLEKLIKNKPYLVAQATQQSSQPTDQSLQSGRPATPAIPAMNPGRSQIAQPGTTPPGKIPRLSDVWSRR